MAVSSSEKAAATPSSCTRARIFRPRLNDTARSTLARCKAFAGNWTFRPLPRVEARGSLMTELKIVSNATCTFCGCVCDDMELTVEGNHITKAKNACVLGKAWFLNHHVEERPVATIHGQ